ncbi:MAG: Gfo/Idh/MocA family oxidoreductase [Spirochaetales bacterium]|jgi:NDP-hexose-3-ketoreductase|nr:Gfo/Idh/MocA family oxidoreductase [Spirochaetales bacterium]
MMGSVLNFACWSLGQHAIKNILPAIKQSAKTNLIGIYTRDQVKLKECSTRFSCKAYSSVIQMLSDENIDAIYISSPTGIHGEQVRSALYHGKHVLVEKTAFSSLALTQELVDFARNNNLVLMEAFMYRFHQQFQLLKDLDGSGKYGKLKEINCRFGFPHLDKKNIRYSKCLAGGALNDAGSYTISAAHQLLGESATVVWSTVGSEEGYEVDTIGASVLINGYGVIANCSWGFGFSYINEIRLWYEKAHILVDRAYSKPDTFDSSILVFSNGHLIEKLISGCDNHFESMIDYFSATIYSDHFICEYEQLVNQAELIELVRCSPPNTL